MFDFINKIVRIMKNKNSGPSLKKKKSEMATGRAIAYSMILAVSISVAIGCDSPNNPGPQPPPPGPAASDDEIPVDLESYWKLEKEPNCSRSEDQVPNVKMPSGYAALICGEISEINMINVFVFSWKWEEVKQANKSNVLKSKNLKHQVYFVPLNYRWKFESKSEINRVGEDGIINLIEDSLSDVVKQNFKNAMKGKTDVFFIGMASREGDLQIEEERSRSRAENLHEAFYGFLPNPQDTKEHILSFGKYDDKKCPPLVESEEERPIIIAMISGSGKSQQDAMGIYENIIKPELEEKVEKVIEGILNYMNKNSSYGRKLIKPSCYSRGEKPEVIPIPPS